MKIAIVHDYLREWGGAEEVLRVLHELYPDAPIFTAYATSAIRSKLGEADAGRSQHDEMQWDIRESKYAIIFRLFNKSHLLTPLLPRVFQSFDLSDYDLVISSSSAFAKCVKVSPSTVHICYCHTVPRFLYGLERERRRSVLFDILEKPSRPYLQEEDHIAAKRVNYFIANSHVVAKRIHDFYGKGAQVIYPPVDAIKFKKQDSRSRNQVEDRYFLIMGRLTPIKRFDVAIAACNQLQVQLQVIGEGRDEVRLRSIAGPTIEFLGRLSDTDAAQVIAGCEAVIVTTPDEDFGMLPIEILGAGKPVITFASEAAKETLEDGTTGPFYYENTPESLSRVLANFQPERYDAKALASWAEKFSKERFEKEIQAFVERFGEKAEHAGTS